MADLSAPALTLQGKPFRNGTARFEGKLAAAGPQGSFTANGRLGALSLQAAARLSSGADRAMRIEGISATAGASTLSGDLTLLPDGRSAGRLAIATPDIASIAPLFLVKASGALDADIVLTAPDERQDAGVKARARSLMVETVRIGSADVEVTGTDLLRSPALSGRPRHGPSPPAISPCPVSRRPPRAREAAGRRSTRRPA